MMLHIVAHIDVDGIACHAIAEMWAKKSEIITKHYFVDYQDIGIVLRLLSEIVKSEDEVIIADIGYSKDLIDLFLGQCGKLAPIVSWFDHHRWEEEARDKMSLSIKKLIINEGLCASEIVQEELLPESETARNLASFARAHDFNGEGCDQDIFYHACKIQDVITSGYPKQAIVKKLSEGILWDHDFNIAYMQYQEVRSEAMLSMDNTIKRFFVSVDSIDIIIVTAFASDNLEAKYAKRYLFERNQCDVVIVVWPNGRMAQEVRSNKFMIVLERINKFFKGGGRGLVGGGTYYEAVNEENCSQCFMEIVRVITDDRD
ncbi:MAG: hypothetical protein PHV29_01365 [Candidatus Pacebacteria bacterium]|nr:hypothetical protein [Candidatus Paceibacterota bacterium]MDD2757240.1 hypothetical protein [Candidatus Paceibacterota bacterium]